MEKSVKIVRISEDFLYELTGVSLYDNGLSTVKEKHLKKIDTKELSEIMDNPKDSEKLNDAVEEVREFDDIGEAMGFIKEIVAETMDEDCEKYSNASYFFKYSDGTCEFRQVLGIQPEITFENNVISV